MDPSTETSPLVNQLSAPSVPPDLAALPNPAPSSTSTSTSTGRRGPQDDAALLAAWQISPSTHAHILHTQILPRELHPFLPNPASSSDASPPSRARPLAVFILGQTGAGKTRLAPLLLSAMSNTYKTYHPHYATALAAAPHLASRLASRDAARWLRAVCACAARHGVARVLVESACRARGDLQGLEEEEEEEEQGGVVGRGWGRIVARGEQGRDGNGFTNTNNSTTNTNGSPTTEADAMAEHAAAPQNENGEPRRYRVRVAVLAVPAALSRLGILVRYHRRLPEAGSRGLPVRLTPRRVHDESFAGLAEAVRWLDGHGPEQAAVERVVVVRRNVVVAYADERGQDGRWMRGGEGGGALRALEAERERPLSVEERRAAGEDIAALRSLGDPEVDRELDEIEALIAALGVEEQRAPAAATLFDAEAFVSTS
ncbi:ae803682-ead2-4287-8f7c-2540ac8e1b05 [Thermothielavioides terrestris]|uniref:Ae803682-ead2-4287-8f7c-2540ac8e1b05 n=1 Tax=Thermothielavioides terrestris TaxID=2587410 RepID=A0A3S4AY95_9PEZI|nr:ae803682-ead2-4287-8f7c-2540ac8e1b05 [Thermothielavioides terrestris]